MNKEKHIVLLGAGAVGVLPAVKLLLRKDLRLTVAADSQRVERYRRDGIFFNGQKIPFDFASCVSNFCLILTTVSSLCMCIPEYKLF